MTNFIFNNLPGREQVKVLCISSLLVCSQHCQATFKIFESYANTQGEKKNNQATRCA